MNEEQQKNLENYIRQQLLSGQSPDTLHTQLIEVGWPQDAIQQAFYAAQSAFIPTTMSRVPNGVPTTASTPGRPTAAGQKHGRLRTGWALFKQSLTMLNGNRYLLRYLAMTFVWALAITAVFVAINLIYDSSVSSSQQQADTASTGLKPLGYLLAALDYLSIYFIINLYAAGLTANVFDIFHGTRKPYAEYMKLARSKARAIFVYSLIQCAVGMFLQYVVERIKFMGWIIAWLLGTAWSLATLFVIPIIVDSDHPSGIGSIKTSMKFFKQTWGENITAKVSVNAPLALLNIILIVLFFVGLFPITLSGNIVLMVVYLALSFLAIFSLAVVGSFANSLINIALYYYATQHVAPPAFSEELLNSVFIKRKRGLLGKKDPASPTA